MGGSSSTTSCSTSVFSAFSAFSSSFFSSVLVSDETTSSSALPSSLFSKHTTSSSVLRLIVSCFSGQIVFISTTSTIGDFSSVSTITLSCICVLIISTNLLVRLGLLFFLTSDLSRLVSTPSTVLSSFSSSSLLVADIALVSLITSS